MSFFLLLLVSFHSTSHFILISHTPTLTTFLVPCSVPESEGVNWVFPDASALGQVHIISTDDVFAPLNFQPGYLEPSEDRELFIWGYKKTREYARRMKCYRGEYAPEHPSFAEESDAVCKEDAMPVPTGAPDIVYSTEDDEAIWKYVQERLSTTWHSIGTCAMKPRVEGGVVDSRLSVYGVRNLKVADLSICPGNVAANTYSTALLIGEKAACIMAEDLGIQGV
ncbi:hypothetical protein QCA50_008093 [Cerrena zonata]|uniref:Glucose-methanol-choline oxidoreductase C-terminal domain-containing protein n=1 Tax=Cerrena zonata TaxID=2478898 RepID=A0AAW0GHY0_9APHY